MNFETILQEYQPYIAGLIILVIVISCKSEKFRNWLIRIIIFALIFTACYFGFQKIKYRFKSGKEVNPFNEKIQAEENAGMKYYRDPGGQLKD